MKHIRDTLHATKSPHFVANNYLIEKMKASATISDSVSNAYLLLDFVKFPMLDHVRIAILYCYAQLVVCVCVCVCYVEGSYAISTEDICIFVNPPLAQLR